MQRAPGIRRRAVPRWVRRGAGSASLATIVALVATGCGGNGQSALAPKSPQSRDIATLFWWMSGVAWFGLGLVTCLLVLAWVLRRRRGFGSDTEGEQPGERVGWYVVLTGGLLLPIVVLSALFVIANILMIGTTQAPAAGETRMTVDVVGHEWWWEVRYPGTPAVTANEIHIPARTAVRLRVTTADVIHSFWVPELNRKIDTMPGTWNAITLYADRPGVYRGDCAEFCGIQHAHMGLEVIADPPATFQRWLAAEAAPAAGATGSGARLFDTDGCDSCHAIRGTTAGGDVGPDLTHLMSRSTLAALTLPNTPADLRTWIAAPQHPKPGNQMPALQLSASDVNALATYLEGLR